MNRIREISDLASALTIEQHLDKSSPIFEQVKEFKENLINELQLNSFEMLLAYDEAGLLGEKQTEVYLETCFDELDQLDLTVDETLKLWQIKQEHEISKISNSVNQFPQVKLKIVREKNILSSPIQISSPNDLVELMKPVFNDLDREQIYCLNLDNQNHPLNMTLIAQGGSTKMFVAPRDVFKTALLCNASKIILFHNHPSGSSMPSMSDIELTKKIRDVGNFLRIPLLDHIVLGDDNFVSMHKLDLLDFSDDEIEISMKI